LILKHEDKIEVDIAASPTTYIWSFETFNAGWLVASIIHGQGKKYLQPGWILAKKLLV